MQINLSAPLFYTQGDGRAKILLRSQNGAPSNGLTHRLNFAHIREFRRVVHVNHLSAFLNNLINHRGRRGNEIKIIFALQTFLNDFHVQHAQKATAEPEAQRVRRLWLVEERRVIQRQLPERVPKILIVIRIDGENTGINLGLHPLEAGQSRRVLMRSGNQRIAYRGSSNILDAGYYKTHLARHQHTGFCSSWCENTDHICLMLFASRRHNKPIPLTKLPLLHPNQ